MKILIQILVITLLCSVRAIGQDSKPNLSGTAVDSLGAPLIGATVMLLNEKDSVLVQFAATDVQGAFELKKLRKQRYILRITYIGYENYQQTLDLNETTDLGPLILHESSAFLDEVVVEGEHSPIKFNRDTIEYNTAALKLNRMK